MSHDRPPCARDVILTGGPGAGKTTLLAELAARGHATVAESARAVIAERLAAGLPPRPAPVDFAREVLRRELAACRSAGPATGWRFFDRGPVDALGLLHAAGGLGDGEIDARLRELRFHPTVFLLPAWEAIYTTDRERDHDFDHALRVCGELHHWYRRCGYTLHELPCLPVAARADLVLSALGEPPAASPRRDPRP